MTASPAEWVLIIFYGPSAHRATYGRFKGTHYTKDFLQLTRTSDFVSNLRSMFPPDRTGVASLTYKWPNGTAPGQIVFHSADRPHLSWGTRLGAPAAWKMKLAPTDSGTETIPGDPSHSDERKAEAEYRLISQRGGGQPYLMAIKLQGEVNTLHLRAYLANPDQKYAWADIKLTPNEIQELAAKTSRQKALAWSMFEDTLFFDPDQNHDAWSSAKGVTSKGGPVTSFVSAAEVPESDLAAEALESSAEDVEAFRKQIEEKDYAVSDSFITAKTRGSAQKAFADQVKGNYGLRCAITDISTKDFLIAAHIVPWSLDQTIRLDPSNGICLSLVMDRAFENGYLLIKDDFTVVVDWKKVGRDQALQALLRPYDGKKLNLPKHHVPKVNYLRRRRKQVRKRSG